MRHWRAVVSVGVGLLAWGVGGESVARSPVKVEDKRFSIDLELGRAPGLNSITIWAKRPASPKLFMISQRTITVAGSTPKP